MNQHLPASPELQDAFRTVFRGHPAGVTLITGTVDGQPVGITATSVSSLCLLYTSDAADDVAGV